MYALSLEKKNEAVPWGLANNTNPRMDPDAILQPFGKKHLLVNVEGTFNIWRSNRDPSMKQHA